MAEIGSPSSKRKLPRSFLREAEVLSKLGAALIAGNTREAKRLLLDARAFDRKYGVSMTDSCIKRAEIIRRGPIVEVDIASERRALYRAARRKPDAIVGVGKLCRTFGIQLEWAPIRALGQIWRPHGQWVIYIREGIDIKLAHLVCGHELAHFWFKRRNITWEQRPDIEELCDRLGAAIVWGVDDAQAMLEALEPDRYGRKTA